MKTKNNKEFDTTPKMSERDPTEAEEEIEEKEPYSYGKFEEEDYPKPHRKKRELEPQEWEQL